MWGILVINFRALTFAFFFCIFTIDIPQVLATKSTFLHWKSFPMFKKVVSLPSDDEHRASSLLLFTIVAGTSFAAGTSRWCVQTVLFVGQWRVYHMRMWNQSVWQFTEDNDTELLWINKQLKGRVRPLLTQAGAAPWGRERIFERGH